MIALITFDKRDFAVSQFFKQREYRSAGDAIHAPLF
jgi:hypothetical protein